MNPPPEFPTEDASPACPPEIGKDGDGPVGAPSPSVIDLPANPDLVRQGWERRFVADPSRLQEATELYTALGYEVHSEPLSPAQLSEECSDCSLVACQFFFTIYTRKP